VVGVTAPLPAGDVVFAVSKTGQLLCASRDTGQIYWIRDLNQGFKPHKRGGIFGFFGQEATRPIWSTPLLVGGRLILVGSSGDLVAVDPMTGDVKKRVDLGAPALLSPIVAGDTLYVLTDAAQLIALR
jgi:outer membrane protein assembly factor BamB